MLRCRLGRREREQRWRKRTWKRAARYAINIDRIARPRADITLATDTIVVVLSFHDINISNSSIE